MLKSSNTNKKTANVCILRKKPKMSTNKVPSLSCDTFSLFYNILTPFNKLTVLIKDMANSLYLKKM